MPNRGPFVLNFTDREGGGLDATKTGSLLWSHGVGRVAGRRSLGVCRARTSRRHRAALQRGSVGRRSLWPPPTLAPGTLALPRRSRAHRARLVREAALGGSADSRPPADQRFTARPSFAFT